MAQAYTHQIEKCVNFPPQSAKKYNATLVFLSNNHL